MVVFFHRHLFFCMQSISWFEEIELSISHFTHGWHHNHAEWVYLIWKFLSYVTLIKISFKSEKYECSKLM